ncbi:cilia- and flagella-associated protein 99 [Exaiptasia diaphana]|uniref:Cilia- and flagella-associated protein 99 n=1 Tax=Exaiptasia diaphana TaxID=2652724 RepID=A0A913X7T5_EXADI|nr:cilia- and flagella-associated protein 99 [Exaiptasia diaphana]KXJ14416.1 Cilia- and flagella-associated protein 99 [Exaiptasia diaphana]
MRHKQLLSSCVELLGSFNASLHGVQEHVDSYLSSVKDVEENDTIFVTEVFSGCVQHIAILKVVVDAFYADVGKNCLRVDRNLYIVLTYLALYRLDELGLSHFKKFVASQDSNKMYRYLAFMFDENNIKTWMKDEWSKQYEQSYVKSKLVSPLLRWMPELRELVSKLEYKQTNNRPKSKPSKPATEPKPFNLTKPRPRSIPMPEKIPKLNKSKPVPDTTYKQPKEEETLSKVREVNRKKAEEELMRSSAKQFSCASAEKSSKTKERLDRIIQDEESKLQFNKSKLTEVPLTTTGNIPIRLNAAAIMREGVLFEKKEEEELKRLAEFEKGGRDPSEFLKWQENMRKKDMDDRLAEIEKRRLEGKLSYEEAILARQNLIKENQERVLQIKQETQEMMNEYMKKKLDQEQEMRKLVEDTMEGHQNTKEARKKLREFKQKIVQDVAKESQEMMRKALEEAEEEMRQKVALIAKIRAIESVPVIRFKYVDLTETSGAGLLGEMSIAELRERLSLLKTAEEEEKEKKRDGILKSKVEKDQYLMDTLETIARHRAEKGKEAAVRQEEKKRIPKQAPKDPKLQELQDKLEARKAERKRESQKIAQTLAPKKALSRRQKQLEEQKGMIEEMRWKELEETRERAAKLRGDGLASRTSNGVRPVAKLRSQRPAAKLLS